MTRSKWPSIYPPNRTISRCLYVASSAVPIQIPHPRKLPHFTLSKQWARQISRSTESTGRRQPAAGRKRGRCCMTVHERSLLLYWVGGSCRGETTGLAGSGRWKGKGWKGKCEFLNTTALVHTLAIIELRQTVFWPHPFFLQKKCCRSKNLYGKPGLFWSTDLLLPKKGC